MINIHRSLLLSMAILSSLVSVAAQAQQAFLVAPSRVMLDMSKTQTQTFIITNTGNEKVRLNLEPVYLPIGDDGMKVGRLINDISGIEDISGSIRVSPKKLSLEPGQRRDVRIQVKGNPGAADGDYRAHLMVRGSGASGAKAVEIGTNGASVKIDINLQTAVAIYARKGVPSTDISLSCYRENGANALLVTNNAAFRMDGVVMIGKRNVPILSFRDSEQVIHLQHDDMGKVITVVDKENKEVARTVCANRIIK